MMTATQLTVLSTHFYSTPDEVCKWPWSALAKERGPWDGEGVVPGETPTEEIGPSVNKNLPVPEGAPRLRLTQQQRQTREGMSVGTWTEGLADFQREGAQGRARDAAWDPAEPLLLQDIQPVKCQASPSSGSDHPDGEVGLS